MGTTNNVCPGNMSRKTTRSCESRSSWACYQNILLLTIYIQLSFLLIFRYFISYELVFFRDKIKKIDLTRGWLKVGSWLEVDLGSRLTRVTLQLYGREVRFKSSVCIALYPCQNSTFAFDAVFNSMFVVRDSTLQFRNVTLNLQH